MSAYLFLIFLGYHPSDPKKSVNAKCLELQMKSLKVADNLGGGNQSSSDWSISYFVWCEQLVNENAVKSGLWNQNTISQESGKGIFLK